MKGDTSEADMGASKQSVAPAVWSSMGYDYCLEWSLAKNLGLQSSRHAIIAVHLGVIVVLLARVQRASHSSIDPRHLGCLDFLTLVCRVHLRIHLRAIRNFNSIGIDIDVNDAGLVPLCIVKFACPECLVFTDMRGQVWAGSFDVLILK